MLNLLLYPMALIKKHVRHVFFGKRPESLPQGSLVIFPIPAVGCFYCGIAGLVAYRGMERETFHRGLVPEIRNIFFEISTKSVKTMSDEETRSLFLGGERLVEKLYAMTNDLRRENALAHLLEDEALRNSLAVLVSEMEIFLKQEKKEFRAREFFLKNDLLTLLSDRLEKFQDTLWHLSFDILGNVDKVQRLMKKNRNRGFFQRIRLFQRINTVLASIEFLEVRGRDSAGISLFVTLEEKDFNSFREKLETMGLLAGFMRRTGEKILGNGSIRLQKSPRDGKISLFFIYKVAEEIGSLGDNGAFLRKAIVEDPVFQEMSLSPLSFFSVASHTRWASVGKVTLANCHPVDNMPGNQALQQPYTIMAALNGDIDNFEELKKLEGGFSDLVPEEITTDTRVIPLVIEKYLKEGFEIKEAFRKAVSDFTGSHAIWMQTDLAPGKLFLAQRGSGQAVFVGMGQDHYLVASEAYGFVTSTPYYIKMEGEKKFLGETGETQGQILVLSEGTGNSMTGISGMYYDGTPFAVLEKNLKHTAITTRDIDRQNYPHYFIKEISESPASISKTLQGRHYIENSNSYYSVSLEKKALPEHLKQDFKAGKIRNIFIIGQGTASIAAQVAAELFRFYLADPGIRVLSMKSSELSGFHIPEGKETASLAETLVIAISQSGTTTDTNHCVDMTKARGAKTLAIVNRRDSDLTFKTDGTLYTSSGRDIEMSVASTKAFYAQIVAAALLGLEFAKLGKKRNAAFISNEILELKSLPEKMLKILNMKEEIGKGARELAPLRNYWACVGSGPNKNAADEIRIKLSELCYRTISSDYVEDKKHIDLSAEPLIFVCAAGTRESVLGDVIKDTRIFNSHKALPVVAVSEGESRFGDIARQIIPIPDIPEHLAPVLITLAGHIWGYYAALAIHDASIFFAGKHRDIMGTIDKLARKGKDIHEIVLEASFREKIAEFNLDFSRALADGRLNSLMGARETAEFLLLSFYLCGRLSISESAMDFGDEENAGKNILDRFLDKLEKTASFFSRPIDAIKHQAKTVTVGTSRITEQEEGILFESLQVHGIQPSQLSSRNILVLRNLQAVVSKVNGAVLYRVEGLNLLGEVTENTRLSIEKKTGNLTMEPSRVETDPSLKGSKRIIVQEGNVFIGLGKKDGRQIVIIPAFSDQEKDARAIAYLLSLNIDLVGAIALEDRIRALGKRLDRIRNNVNEYSFEWKDEYLDFCTTQELFGLSAEKIVEIIVKRLKEKTNGETDVPMQDDTEEKADL